MNFPFQLFQRSCAVKKLYPSRRRKIFSSVTVNMFDYVNRIAQDKREDGSCSSKGASFASFENQLFCTVTRVYSVFEKAIRVVVGDTQSSSSVQRAPSCASFHLKSSQQKYFERAHRDKTFRQQQRIFCLGGTAQGIDISGADSVNILERGDVTTSAAAFIIYT